MEPRVAIPLLTSLPRPPRGASTRLQFGTKEVVFEATRGGYALLWLDGRVARRFAVGLPEHGDLHLQLRAPRLPVRVETRDTLTLAPGSRLRGYVQVPLVPTIVWQPPPGDEDTPRQSLVEFPRAELAAEWDDREGTIYRCVSAFHVRYPQVGPEPQATVPVWLGNPTDRVACPAYVPLLVTDDELHEQRRGVAILPRRLCWSGQGLQSAPRRRTEVMR